MPARHPMIEFALSGARPWQPPGEVTDHFGKPIPPGRDFFLPPPPEIGTVRSAWSTLQAEQNLWPFWLKILLSPLLAALVASVALALVQAHVLSAHLGHLIAFLGGFCVLVIALARALGRNHLSYIGDQGVAFYWTRGTRDSTRGQVASFADVADIRYRRKLYKTPGTEKVEFQFRLVDASGRTLLRLAANEARVLGRFPQDSVFAIAVATHDALKRFRGVPGPAPAAGDVEIDDDLDAM